MMQNRKRRLTPDNDISSSGNRLAPDNGISSSTNGEENEVECKIDF